ncbi:MAG TPA: putative sulfate exporter family transporter [Candidatus Limnocylindrales bacterium]|nr:putative sulfate exporter family transporter [Candidatus Limnocylindrales bacterium]
MASSQVLTAPQSFSWPRRLVSLVPGIALLAIVGMGGKVLEQGIARYSKAHHLVLPNVEYVLWAIGIGLVISNVFGVAEVFKPGIATYEFWLKSGIVLLGSRFILGDVFKLGAVSLALVLIELALSIGLMTVLGRVFKLSPKLTTLLAVGSSICGVSAIIATKGAIDADDEDASFAIAAILALGALALFTFPSIGHALGMSDHVYGLWAGTGVDNTAEAVAAGALYSDAAAKIAVLAKTTRNALIGFVVLAYALYWAAREGRSVQGNKAAFLWQKFPKFVLGFLLVSALASVSFFTHDQLSSIANLSKWAFLLTFAGVGLKINFRDMKKQGLRPFLVGAIGEVVIAAITLGLVLAANKIVKI